MDHLVGFLRGWSSSGAVAVAVLSVVVLEFCRRRFFRGKKFNLPPNTGPAYPCIGNMLELKGIEMHEEWYKLALKTKWPIMTFNFSNDKLIIVNSPELIKEMLITRGREFNSRVRYTRTSAGLKESIDGSSETGALFTPDGHAWKATRKLMVAGQVEFRKVEGDRHFVNVLLPELYKEIESVETIDARDRICKMMLVKILLVFVFGPGAEGYAEVIYPLNDQLFHVVDVNHMIELFLPLIGWPLSHVYNKFVQKALVAKKQKLWEKILSERGVKFNLEKKWSLSDMVQAAEAKGEINHQQALEVYEETFFAGQDAVTAAVEGLLKILVENPEILSKVQQEMDDVLGTGTQFRHEDVEKLPYLQAVVKEGLRLHRAIPMLLPHATREDTTLGGYDIPKDTSTSVNLWGLARNPEIFPDPFAVKPERFLNTDYNFTGTDCKYITFGLGPRICPGQILALLTTYMLVGSLAQRYNFALGKNWTHERDSGTLFKEVALILKLTKRDGF